MLGMPDRGRSVFLVVAGFLLGLLLGFRAAGPEFRPALGDTALYRGPAPPLRADSGAVAWGSCVLGGMVQHASLWGGSWPSPALPPRTADQATLVGYLRQGLAAGTADVEITWPRLQVSTDWDQAIVGTLPLANVSRAPKARQPEERDVPLTISNPSLISLGQERCAQDHDLAPESSSAYLFSGAVFEWRRGVARTPPKPGARLVLCATPPGLSGRGLPDLSALRCLPYAFPREKVCPRPGKYGRTNGEENGRLVCLASEPPLPGPSVEGSTPGVYPDRRRCYLFFGQRPDRDLTNCSALKGGMKVSRTVWMQPFDAEEVFHALQTTPKATWRPRQPPIQVQFDARDGSVLQKNWVPWSPDGHRLHLSYGVEPHVVLLLNTTSGVGTMVANTSAPEVWRRAGYPVVLSEAGTHGRDPKRPYMGQQRSVPHLGTPALLIQWPAGDGGKARSFFLSVMHTLDSGRVGHRVYQNVAYLFQSEAPFRLLAASRPLPLKVEPSFRLWRNGEQTSFVAFASGLTLTDDGRLAIAYGCGDRAPRVFTIPLRQFFEEFFPTFMNHTASPLGGST